MARAPIPCPVCDSVHTRVRDTVPVDQADLCDDRYVRLFAAVHAELGADGNLTGQLRVQLLECASCPADAAGHPRVYRLTYLPPTYVETKERSLRPDSRLRHCAN